MRRHIVNRGKNGQAMVEFALIVSLALTVILGIIAGSFVFFQNEAVRNGARGGARYGTIESSLYSSSTSAGVYCESGTPDSVVNAVKKATNILPLNTAPLCSVSTTELQQMPVDPKKANIVVDASPSLANPSCVTVTVTYQANILPSNFPHSVVLQGFSSSPAALYVSTGGGGSSTSSGFSCPGPSSPNYSITWSPGGSSGTTRTTTTSTTTVSTTTTTSSSASTTTTTTTSAGSTSCPHPWNPCGGDGGGGGGGGGD